ncbi:MAG: hypothetical protein KatS3mg059_0117 [Thermomicrobiales bacterium]|nr:MAG: hypothetical protein KatS3mg059_0117 [Thermomicrobiales bacterium]
MGTRPGSRRGFRLRTADGLVEIASDRGIGAVSERSDEALKFERDIHERLLGGDRTAASDLCARFLGRLCRTLQGMFPKVDADLVSDAVTNALLNYSEHPDRFDPAKRSLAGYLVMSARGDLLNLLRARKHEREELPLNEDVENSSHERNRLAGTGESPDDILDSLIAEECRQQVIALAKNDEERIVLQLMMDGERETGVFLEQLGWQGPRDELSTRLYRLKDRLVKRARRSLGVDNG